MSSIAAAIFLLAAAGFAFSTATVQWRSLRDHPRAEMVRKVLGDAGARSFYVLLGLALLALAAGTLWSRFVP